MDNSSRPRSECSLLDCPCAHFRLTYGEILNQIQGRVTGRDNLGDHALHLRARGGAHTHASTTKERHGGPSSADSTAHRALPNIHTQPLVSNAISPHVNFCLPPPSSPPGTSFWLPHHLQTHTPPTRMMPRME